MVTTSSFPSLRPLLVPRDRFVGGLPELVDPRPARRIIVPLVTLTGPAGVGKSRLALEAAGRPGRVPGRHQVRLLPAGADAGTALSAIAKVLPPAQAGGDRSSSGWSTTSALPAAAGAGRDGALVDAGPILADLLAACPDVQALATSRLPLRVSGERELAVGPLALPGRRRRVPQHGRERERRLFPGAGPLGRRDARAERADRRRHRGDLAELDGLPLAIELAAARARALSVWEVRDRLDRPEGRLDFLEGDSDGQPVPQR